LKFTNDKFPVFDPAVIFHLKKPHTYSIIHEMLNEALGYGLIGVAEKQIYQSCCVPAVVFPEGLTPERPGLARSGIKDVEEAAIDPHVVNPEPVTAGSVLT
jgi:hypothetical protein